jgi:CRISPR system Cascade subunit CasC
MSENCALPGGLIAALFGRMVTSDPAANIEAPVHVAHAFTVHGEEAEGDYFTAVDDLKKEDDDSGADTVQETELTCGLFYGYAVIDLPGLIANCGGDSDLAGRVVQNLIYLIAEVSPGAKLGSTAPYARAGFMLLEAGDRQPRSLAEAFRKPAKPDLDEAVEKLESKLAGFDQAYATGESRICLNLSDKLLASASTGTIGDLANWAEARAKEAGNA